MVAAIRSPEPAPAQPEERVLLTGVPWSTYVVLRDTVDSSGIRMTYLKGSLEIMSPSKTHEVNKTQIARLLELFCLERDIPLFGYGSTTFRREEEERGLEPDECYARGGDKDVPDLALEVVVSHGAIDKMEVYRGLGIAEVWVFEAGSFTVHRLHEQAYRVVDESVVLPEVDLAQLATFALRTDQHEALRSFRQALRSEPR
ncbi:MAG: Uma2 family endonuclease [Myxococcota bacterium]